MDNKELELRIKDILKEENFFDMIIKTKQFEKEYKLSEFYKETRMDLMDVIKEAKVFYLIKLDDLFVKLQEKINTLDLDNLMGLFDKLANVFSEENDEVKNILTSFKETFKEEE